MALDDATFKALIEKGMQRVASNRQQDRMAAPVDPNDPTRADPETGESYGFDQNPAGATLPGGEVEQPIDDPSKPLEAAAGGALKAGFEVKDTLTGQTAPEDRSEVRRAVEDRVDTLREEAPLVNGLSAGIGQFATGMIGLGAMGQGLKLVPWFGRAVGLAESVKGGAVAVEAGKAALVGATAFDPYEERLSDLIQETPLANPVNAWLASDPSDSVLEGRAKAALESIGMDAVLLGTFMLAGKAYRAMRYGKEGEAQAAIRELNEAIQRNVDEFSMDFGPGPAQAPSPAAAVPDVGGVARAVAQDAPSPSAPVKAPVDSRPVDAELEPEAVEVVVAPSDTTKSGPEPDATVSQMARPRVALTDENTDELFASFEADARAYETHGDWTATIESGHTFAKGEQIPYQKLGVEGNAELNNFMARVTEVSEDQMRRRGLGKVLSDERLDRMVRYRASLTGERPDHLMAMLQRAGEQSTRLAANMETGYLVSSRMFMDSFALATKISMGDYLQYGSKEAALEALKQQTTVAASVFTSARQMTQAAGRAMRRMREDFQIDPEVALRLKAIDGDALVNLLVSTKGSPKEVGKVLQKGMLEKVTDGVNFLLVNNLVSGFPTQAVNLLSNAYMVGARPMERILGSAVPASLGSADARAVFKNSVKQYAFLTTAARSGFKYGVQAFMRGDSILSPHTTEVYGINTRMGQPRFKPMDSIGGALHNVGQLSMAAIGIPTRVLGGTDELVKQTVYRSYVMSEAYVNASAEGVQQGLKGKDLKDFVRARVQSAVDNAFDDLGRATNPKALEEAHVATFQQALLTSSTNPGGRNTLGASAQLMVGRHPALRFVLPFVRTPSNVIRYGWKMSPGLNLLQGEYRAMLTGKMGAEKQAQAVGQMAMGTLFMASAADLIANGSITGAGPSDPKKQRELMATGWRPYSIAVKNDDGTTSWYSYGRFDPVAIPIGIMADLMDAMEVLDREDNEEVEAAITGLSMALAKQFTSKSYMSSLDQFLDAVSSGESDKITRYAGGMVGNLVPYSAMLRNTNEDPYLKEARTLADRAMAGVPGLSEGVPNRYDAWGEPVLARRGLWATGTDEAVDTEIQRMLVEAGEGPVAPQPRRNGVDLRDITTADGENAFEVYNQLIRDLGGRAPRLKDIAGKLMSTRQYQLAPDGPASAKGTKLWMLETKVLSRYRESAFKMLKADPNVRKALGEEQQKVFKRYEENLRDQKALDTNTTQGLIDSLTSIGD